MSLVLLAMITDGSYPTESIQEMTRIAEAVVSSGFRESMRVPPLLGDGWRESEFQFNDDDGGLRASRNRVRRSRALEMTGAERHVTLEWKPWPRRHATDAPPLTLLRMVDA